MNMTTQKTSVHLARNYAVASVQKKVFARSNIGFIFVDKEYIDQPADTTMFNRVAGFDYNLASKNNFWTGKFYYHRSFQPDNPDKQYSEGSEPYLQQKENSAWSWSKIQWVKITMRRLVMSGAQDIILSVLSLLICLCLIKGW